MKFIKGGAMEIISTEKHKFMDLPQVMEVIRASRSHIYALVAEGGFPPPIKIGPRLTRWVEAEVQAWMEEQIAKSRNAEKFDGIEFLDKE